MWNPVYQRNNIVDWENIDKLKNGKKFEEKDIKILNKKFSLKEIIYAIKMTPNRAPGPSGIRITLFKTFIQQFAPILKDVANEALLNGTTSEFLLNGIITLIPKKENSNNVNDMRPITLLEIPRKIITKAMTFRIKQVLSSNIFINEFQFCHPGRLIHENVHTLNLLIERAKSKGTNLHAAFLDCSKAFDYVSHDYLIEILKERKCGENFLKFISCFLKGTSKIVFKNSTSDKIKIERGVPQGETLSPFLFILAIDPLLNAINDDKNIKGSIIANKRVKVMAYADDLVLISESKKDIERMLKHVKVYESASNAKLNETKSQILSFGKEKVDCISGIKHTEENERVRHLGFYFDRKGLINNIDEILQKVLIKLKTLRNLFPNFTTRVNIWKGYAISSLLYQSEVIVMNEKQIEEFEKMEKWFLFSNNINDVEINSIDDLEKRKSNISLDRLELPKKYGGMNLRRIKDIFSAAKAKVLMRALLKENKTKPFSLLLFEKSELFYEMEKKENLTHLFYWVDENAKKACLQWEWFGQAYEIFSKIDKDYTIKPIVGDAIYDLHAREVIYFPSNEEIELYKPQSGTIPVNIQQQSKERLEMKKGYYLYREQIKKVDKIVTIGHRNACETPFKTEATRANISEWIEKVDIVFNDLEILKNKKVNLKNIFKITIDNDLKPKWTETQKEWIRSKINLKSLFSTNIKTISRIDDFRRKYLMSYWGKITEKCLCGEEFSRRHLFNRCSVVMNWETNVFGKEMNQLRTESMLDNKSQNHTLSWIYNWCIWKNFWEIVFKKFDNCETIDAQISNFKKFIKFNEYLHLKFSLLTSIKLETVENETKHFHFYQIDLDTLKNGVKGKKGCLISNK